MPLYTTYLAYLKKFDYNPLNIFPYGLNSVIIYYVMRNRGNNEVAPPKLLLKGIKEGKVAWEDYEHKYIFMLENNVDAQKWMQERAKESNAGYHIILVCFEKDPQHCHRRLLAEEMQKWFGAKEYKGELSNFQ